MFHYRLHHDPKSSHQQIANVVRRLRRGPILDVGAAQGMLAHLLSDKALTIDAIEPHPDWARAAEGLYRHIYNCTVEEAAIESSTYQVIVCGDILEHTVDPTRVLRKLCKASQAGGYFIVSLPNVAHLAVRMLLLCGHFPLMERGILDRTHLHFYTLDTARELLSNAGLQVVSARPTGIPLDELWPRQTHTKWFRVVTRLQHILLAFAPRVFAYQWVLVARLR